MNGLIFVDTNKILDFYRAGGDSAFALADILLSKKDQVIITEQVWMEFTKHRQKLMLELWQKVNAAKVVTESLPAAFKEYGATKHMKSQSAFYDMQDQTKREIEDLIWKSDEDPVFDRIFQIYKAASENCLRRSDNEFQKIYSAARQRADLGYPPGKSGTGSIGDAINWEWILRIASRTDESQGPIVIVSRDTDFGVHFGSGLKRRSYLNDFLLNEFTDLSAGTQVLLFDSISGGLKALGVSVQKEIQRAEAEHIDWYRSRGY